MVTIVTGSYIDLGNYVRGYQKSMTVNFPRFSGDGGVMKRVCEWCTATQPAERPSAQDVVDCLTLYLQDQPWSHLINTPSTPTNNNINTRSDQRPQSMLGLFKTVLGRQEEPTFEMRMAGRKSGEKIDMSQITLNNVTQAHSTPLETIHITCWDMRLKRRRYQCLG